MSIFPPPHNATRYPPNEPLPATPDHMEYYNLSKRENAMWLIATLLILFGGIAARVLTALGILK